MVRLVVCGVPFSIQGIGDLVNEFPTDLTLILVGLFYFLVGFRSMVKDIPQKAIQRDEKGKQNTREILESLARILPAKPFGLILTLVGLVLIVYGFIMALQR